MFIHLEMNSKKLIIIINVFLMNFIVIINVIKNVNFFTQTFFKMCVLIIL